GNLGYGAWSIVWMYLSAQIIQTALLWIYSSWKPSLTFSREKMKYHYGFGYKLLLSQLINIGFQNINKVLIGKFFAVQTLGYYERAASFNKYPVTILVGIINNVTYPLLAQIQHEKERLEK